MDEFYGSPLSQSELQQYWAMVKLMSEGFLFLIACMTVHLDVCLFVCFL